MRLPSAARHEARHGTARDVANRLHQHLQIVAIGKAPLYLALRIAG
jgi:hypothetical protein